MFITIIVFILILGLLVFVHELGHFIVAKLFGIEVKEFAFGFPPRLFSKIYRGTRYSFNLVPIGGFVKLLGEDEAVKSPKSFSAKKVLIRLAVVVAGVVMNYLMAILAFTIAFSIGMAPYFSDPSSLNGAKKPLIFVSEVFPDSAAAKSGLKLGDELVDFVSTQAVIDFTKQHAGQEVTIKVIDDTGNTRQVKPILGTSDKPLGVALYETAIVKLSFPKALVAGTKEATNAALFTIRFFGQAIAKLFSTGKAPQEIGGPVAIFGVTAKAVSQGSAAVLRILGILSVNLAILNIIPFPALDGGKALFIAAEGIFGRRVVKENHEAIIHTIGFVLLLALIVAITYRDIIRLR